MFKIERAKPIKRKMVAKKYQQQKIDIKIIHLSNSIDDFRPEKGKKRNEKKYAQNKSDLSHASFIPINL